MKKSVIIYVSTMHKNTEKVVKEISKNLNIFAVSPKEAIDLNLDEYELIIFASGIFYNKMHNSILKFVEGTDLEDKEVGIIYTCGLRYKDHAKPLSKELIKKGAKYIGNAWCRGYDTYGILKAFGGIAKNHPNIVDIQNIENIVKKWLE